MPCIETVVAVLFLDTSFRLICWKLRCHDSSALQTSLQTQKGHALTQSLKGTGYGLDFEVKEMTLLFCFFTEALHGASSWLHSRKCCKALWDMGAPPCGQTDGWKDRRVSKHYLSVVLRTRAVKTSSSSLWGSKVLSYRHKSCRYLWVQIPSHTRTCIHQGSSSTVHCHTDLDSVNIHQHLKVTSTYNILHWNNGTKINLNLPNVPCYS